MEVSAVSSSFRPCEFFCRAGRPTKQLAFNANRRRYPIDEDKSLEPVKTVAAQPVYQACKSGKKCLRYENRKPAAAKGQGEFCSTACGASDRARVKRALAAIPTAQ
jgi:hypothetical protein